MAYQKDWSCSFIYKFTSFLFMVYQNNWSWENKVCQVSTHEETIDFSNDI